MKSSRRTTYRSVIGFIAFALILPFFGSPVAQADEVARKIISGWMPYYSTADSMMSIETNTAYIKEVMPFWYTVKYDAEKKRIRILDLYSAFVGVKGAPVKTVIDSLTAMGKASIPTITDGTSENVLAGLLASPSSRTQLVQLITDLTVTNKFAGIDLDFEGFAFVDKSSTWTKTAGSWVAFIKELSASLHSKEKILSVTTPYVWDPTAKQKGYYVYAWKEIASSIDRLRFMGYDYSVSRPGPIGPISWTEKTLQYATSIMPSSKIYLGLPGYARGWVTSVQGVCPSDVASAIKVGAKTETAMSNIRDLRLTYGFVPIYNELYGEMTFSYDKVYNGLTSTKLATSCTASRTFWYQDQKALAVRAALVPKYKLGGIAMWTLGMEDENAFDGIKEIAIANALDVVSSNLTIDSATVDYGKPITLKANVTYRNGKPLPNAQVLVERFSASEDKWSKIASGTTDISGQLVKQIILGRNSNIRIRTPESEFLTESTSNIVELSVNRLVRINALGSVKINSTLSISGSINPRTKGVYVTLETIEGGAWKTYGVPITTDINGDFNFKIPVSKRGVVTARVSVAADMDFDSFTSQQFSILVRGIGSTELVK